MARVCSAIYGSLFVMCLMVCFAVQASGAEADSSHLRLFGTVEFRRPINTLPVWLSVLKRNQANPIFEKGSRLNASTTWNDLQTQLASLPKLEQLKVVNRFWNMWPYRLDRDVYGKEDYWAAPYEFRKKSGDCEDYSIVKYFTLRKMGFEIDTLRIVVLRDTVRGYAHAVLAVYLDGKIWILDNLSNNVLEHTRLRNYLPQFSVNEKYRWAHIRPKKN